MALVSSCYPGVLWAAQEMLGLLANVSQGTRVRQSAHNIMGQDGAAVAHRPLGTMEQKLLKLEFCQGPGVSPDGMWGLSLGPSVAAQSEASPSSGVADRKW